MTNDAIIQIAKIIDPDFDYESDGVQEDMRRLAAECFSVILPTTMEIVSEREALRAENARLLQKAAAPICVGRPIITILAREGAWTSASGASVVAADELFRNDPYEEIARLRAALTAEQETCIRVGNERAEALLEIEALRTQNMQILSLLETHRKQLRENDDTIETLRVENDRLRDLLDNALGWLDDKEQEKPLLSVDSIRAARAAMGESDE